MKRFLLVLAVLLGANFMVFAQSPASFPGGEEAMSAFIAENIKYPQDAIDNMIEGTAIISFSVDVNGHLNNVKVVRQLDPDLEAEAIRVVNLMPAWQPARDEAGNPIAQDVEIPVKFRLPM